MFRGKFKVVNSYFFKGRSYINNFHFKKLHNKRTNKIQNKRNKRKIKTTAAINEI